VDGKQLERFGRKSLDITGISSNNCRRHSH